MAEAMFIFVNIVGRIQFRMISAVICQNIAILAL